MQIVNYQTFVVGNPPPHFGGRYFIFIKLVTDSGIEGVGEAYCLPFHPRVVVEMLSDLCQRLIIGRNPFHIEALWRIVHGRGYTQHPDLSLMGAFSAIEMACWDIVGKELGKPVYELLGGRVQEKLRSYTYLYPRDGDKVDVYQDPDLAAERAAQYVELGFTAVKFDPLGSYSVFDPRQPSLEALRRAETYTLRVREAVGDRADLLFGTHGQLTPAGAIRLAKRLEPADPLWFEEPVPPENMAAMARVAQATFIPIATGERLTTKYEFARLLRYGAAAILQMNLGRVGGILEAKKIAGMAEAHYAQIAPHLYNGPVTGAANIHISACSPNFLILEGIETWQGFQARLLKKPLRWQDGYVLLPTEPGLGVELDEDVVRAHPYNGDDLHLEMADHPVH